MLSSYAFAPRRRSLPAGARAVAVAALLLLVSWLTPASLAPPARAEERAAPPGQLVKVVMLSRHGVRSPIPPPTELATWTASPWPTWDCQDGNDCKNGDLTQRGAMLALQMGTHYRDRLSPLIPVDRCPQAGEVFFWTDVTERTEATGRALLNGFRREPWCHITSYLHTAQAASDPIFHPVGHGRCRLDPTLAEREIIARARGNLGKVMETLWEEMATAQSTLQCCQRPLCQTVWSKSCPQSSSPPSTCTLTDGLPYCLVRHPATGTPTQVETGGALRIASTFAELLLLEYANKFPEKEVGWGRITLEQMRKVFRIHTTVFDLEQRTPYVAALQGSMLLQKMLLALLDQSDGKPGTAPPGAKLVAYVGHDTNISNVAGMLSLSWQQEGYQKDQTPPAGALVFELRQTDAGERNVYAYYVAQRLEDMRDAPSAPPVWTPVPIPNCGKDGPCPLRDFKTLVRLDPDCS